MIVDLRGENIPRSGYVSTVYDGRYGKRFLPTVDNSERTDKNEV